MANHTEPAAPAEYSVPSLVGSTGVAVATALGAVVDGAVVDVVLFVLVLAAVVLVVLVVLVVVLEASGFGVSDALPGKVPALISARLVAPSPSESAFSIAAKFTPDASSADPYGFKLLLDGDEPV